MGDPERRRVVLGWRSRALQQGVSAMSVENGEERTVIIAPERRLWFARIAPERRPYWDWSYRTSWPGTAVVRQRVLGEPGGGKLGLSERTGA